MNRSNSTYEFTDQQKIYIYYKKLSDTKLIACAGSGKTKCIIERISYIITSKLLLNTEILMLTFSRFTRDDFINKIKKYKTSNIDEHCIKTIDSFAKIIIDSTNEVDVSLLSYKFMKHLEKKSKKDLLSDKELSKIKCIFVDEAQDLNNIQYKIICLLKSKLGVYINLIGDPNQNIYQFRKSSDKYLTEFDAKTFYLTKNFRSVDSIINFSKYLRPVPDLDINGVIGDNDIIPSIILHEDDNDLEKYIVSILNDAKDKGVNYEDIAILAPTRGRMRNCGKSNGLCFISNILYKNGIKFKQFYEESTDEILNNIKYIPETDCVNLLTYMGSKGLEWKYVILIDADICLINKRIFNNEKHKQDQYLLYVACSRAIEGMIIFSKYKVTGGYPSFQLNPWFSLIPNNNYVFNDDFEKKIIYPSVVKTNIIVNEKKLNKIIESFDEEKLNEISNICKFGTNTSKKTKRDIQSIYNVNNDLSYNMFISKYIKNLFIIYYQLSHNLDKKRFDEVEHIINAVKIVSNVSYNVSEWFNKNKKHMTWKEFDRIKNEFDEKFIDCIETKFDRKIELSKHMIVNDNYYNEFILSEIEILKINYIKYLSTVDPIKIRKYLFYIILYIYSFETQHYFHSSNKGEQFKNIMTDYEDLFNEIQKYSYSMKHNFINNDIKLSVWKIDSHIDFIEKYRNKEILWEIKCVSDITLKHVIYSLISYLLYHKITHITKNLNIKLNYINLLKGKLLHITIKLKPSELTKLYDLFNINPHINN